MKQLRSQKIKNCLFIIALTLLSISCEQDLTRIGGEGSIVTQTIPLPEFNSVKLIGATHVDLVTGGSLQAVIEEYENIIHFLEVEVVGQTLYISNDPEIILSNSVAKITITAPEDIEFISSVGSGILLLNSSLSSLNEINLTGSGNIIANSHSEVGSLKTKLRGSGDMELSNITSSNFSCKISGSGDIRISVTNSLDAKITGSGNVYYYGNPDVDANIEGSGNVIKSD